MNDGSDNNIDKNSGPERVKEPFVSTHAEPFGDSGEDERFRVFVSAGEHSGDAHCANLIKSIRKKSYDPINGRNFKVEFVGVGGERMAGAGCEMLARPVERSVMIYKAFASVKYFIGVIKQCREYLSENRVDMVIVCDSPAFNFHIAKAGRKAGVAVMFYVAPQLWAWAPWRIRKLRRLSSKLCCILPFEEQWFWQRGVETVFVGNPLFDDVHIDFSKSGRNYSQFDVRRARIALFPGSRKAEIEKLWPAMQEVAGQLKHRWPGVRFVASAADERKLGVLKEMEAEHFECEYEVANVAVIAQDCDLALVASGSATLQVAAGGCPMVIMYQSSRLLWELAGRWLVRSRFLSLVNILAGKELVPEFMPYFGSTRPIVQRCYSLLSSKTKMQRISDELVEMVRPLTDGSASDRCADEVIGMLKG
jgi:lipid-A-disaccharide synthase